MGTEHILIVEDDDSIREMLTILLDSHGFTQVVALGSGEEAVQQAAKTTFDLILLDLTLPGKDGLEVCRILRNSSRNATTPIVMLTARSEESDIVVGLEMGAVDYIVKPFNNKTLMARIRAHLRRTKELLLPDGEVGPCLKRDNLTIWPEERIVQLAGITIELTYTEFELLLLLFKSPGRVWSRNEIALTVRGDDYTAFDRAIDVQVANLRKKLGTTAGCIETVRGIGYRWKRE